MIVQGGEPGYEANKVLMAWVGLKPRRIDRVNDISFKNIMVKKSKSLITLGRFVKDVANFLKLTLLSRFDRC